MRIDNPISDNAIITGSFTGSFKGDGTNLTGITAEWDGSHTGDASITGALTVGSLITAGVIDGVDVSDLKSNFDTDSAKLAGIESGADVTDGTNVEAAGALMDSEVTNLTQVKAFDSSDYATAAQGSTADSAQQPPSEGAFANGDKTKLDAIAAGAEVNVVDSVAGKTGVVTLVKGDVGLANVDNTADSAKPVSTAGQTALNLKADLASPTFTGTPLSTTPASNDSSTKIATTAYVQGEITDLIGGAGAAFDTLLEISASIANGDSDVVALTSTVSGKLQKDQNLSDLTNNGTARTNLGLGSLATLSTVNAATITDNSVGAAELNVTGNGTTAQYLRSDGDGTFTWATPTDTNTTYSVGDGGLTAVNFTTTRRDKLDGIATSANNYSLPEATATVLGGIELFSNTDQSVAANAVSATAGRTYGLQLNSAGQAVVNIPWVDTNTNTTYTAGTGLTLTGTVFSNNITNNNQLTNGAGYITSYTDTNTTYTAGTGVTLTGTSFSIGQSVGTGDTVQFGTVRATADIVAYYSSDERLKDNMVPLAGALDKVKAMGGYEFDWNAKQDTYEVGEHSIGVKAQEVQAQYPDLVKERGDGYLAVDYVKLTAVLIEAVKELSAKVDELSK